MAKQEKPDFSSPEWQEYFKGKSPEEIEKIKKLLEELRDKTTIGKTIWFKEKEDGTYSQVGKVVDEVSVFDYGYKYFIQKIEYGPEWVKPMRSKFGYRIGYYTIDAKKTKILWGQYACQMPERMFKELIEKARRSFLLKRGIRKFV